MKFTIVRRNAWGINTSFFFLSSCSEAHWFVPSKTLLMWSHVDLDRKIKLTLSQSTVWYLKYQFRWIIALWSQYWKKCATFILWKIFYWRAMSPSLARLDSYRRKLSRWAPFLSNVLKTLSTLGLHAEKKKTNSQRFFKIFYSLVNLWTVL